MKGLWFPEEEGMTVIFIILIISISVIGGLTVLIRGVNGGISYSVEFLPLANKPFALTEVLMHVQTGDRPLLEQAIESAAVGSLEKANAQGMISDLRVLMKTYEVDNYAISTNAMGMDSGGERCGTALQGWCTQSCDVGYVKIDAAGACRTSQVCCQLNVDEYNKKTNHLDVVPCGSGICSAGVMKTAVADAETVVTYEIGPYCGDGMVEIQTNSCKTANGGATKLCCAPKTDQTPVNTLNRASVPLLFKEKIVGYLTLGVGVNG